METPLHADWGIFQNELRSFVFKRVKDKAASDDIVQDVFLKVYNNLGQLKNSEKLTGWIYQITRNTITDHFRKKK
jgi:RNA polymerase sigma-70 factor (ECF subfamily)